MFLDDSRLLSLDDKHYIYIYIDIYIYIYYKFVKKIDH